MTLTPGSRFGHYEILSHLGAGGMGEVFKAKDTRLGREVALKVLRPETLGNTDRRQRFIWEAQTTSALNHPNIVVIYEVGAENGIDFIAMEYVRGKTLDQIIPRKGLRCAEALKYGVAIADALAKAHAAGVVHRDLKPGNIMVNDDGHVKVLDFGLAKLVETSPIGAEEATRTVREPTRDGAIMGTISYMSPEQAEGKPIDARSDIFSFGAVMYEMLTGQKAFHGDSKLSTMSAILRDEPKAVSQAAPDIPRDVEKIVARCLRKDPERRFQHMSDLKVALQEVKEESDSSVSQSGTLPPMPAARRRSAYLAAVAALVSIAAAGVYWKFLQRPPAASTRVTPFTTFAGSETMPAFSPDGNLIAYSWNGPNEDNFDIYVQQIGAGSPLRLTTDPQTDSYPVFSPDGRYIAFTRGRSLIQVPALGGPERKLCTLDGRGNGVDFSPDGKTIAIADRESDADSQGIFLVSMETGAKKRLTAPSAGARDSTPKFSPDGRTIAFVRSPAALIAELHAVSVNGGESKRLSEDHLSIIGLAWMPGGHEILFSATRPGTPLGLWIVAASGGTPRLAPEGGEGASYPAISREGHRLAFNRRRYDTNIWRLELAPGGNLSSENAVKLIASTREDSSARFSPDGKRIAFVSDRSGSSEIWVCNADASNPVQLTTLVSHAGTPRWSPDGRRIAFDARVRGNADIYTIDADGGSPRRVTVNPAEDNVPSWSSNGQWIYFSSSRTGGFELWRIRTDGSQETRMTHRGGFDPQESPDGKVLYYLQRRGTSPIWKMSAGGGAESPVLESATVVGHNYWQLFDDGVYFVQPLGNSPRAVEHAIQFFDFASKKITGIGRLGKPPTREGALTVSPDRRQVLFAQVDQNDSDIVLVENFR